MALSSALGLFGTFIGLIRALPQLILILSTRRAAGVSVDTAAVSALVSFGWAVYGWLTHQLFVSLATGTSGLIFLLITLFAISFGRSPREFKVAPFWLGFLILAHFMGGARGLGILLPLSVLAANGPQIHTAFKEKDLSDLSLGTWAFSLLDGVIWGAYALLTSDLPIQIYALFQLITTTAILVLKITKPRTPGIHIFGKER